jgi:hypothetical protein
MYIAQDKNESDFDFKLRCLEAFLKQIKSTFYLRKAFEVSGSDKQLDDKNVPIEGGVLWLTNEGVYYCFIPYCEPGSAPYGQYRLNNINEFIDGPLTKSVITGNAPYDLKELDNLPENLQEISDRLVDLKAVQKRAAQEQMESLKAGNADASFTDMFENYKKTIVANRSSDKFSDKSDDYYSYAKQVTPIAQDYLKLLLSELTASELVGQINKLIFNQDA